MDRIVGTRDRGIWPFVRLDRAVRPRLAMRMGDVAVLYVVSFLTILALVYLGYAMIRPERF